MIVDQDAVFTAIENLRSMGLAVAVFTPGDVPEHVEDQPAWLVENRRWIEDAMVRAGNDAIEALA